MKFRYTAISIFLFIVSAAFSQEASGDAGQLTAMQIIERSQLAFYYQGDDMKARVSMELIDKGGGVRKRVMTMLRHDEADSGDQKFFMYFHEPGDVREMTFMVWKYPEKEDDRWIFIPAVDLVRRIAADDKRSSFVGSDFTYEDISGRDISVDTHTLLREEVLDGRNCFVVKSVPADAIDYTQRVTWVDKENFLPLKEEYYDVQDELYRVFTADAVEQITVGEGEDTLIFPTVTARTMKNIKTGHRTEVTFTNIEYDTGLQDGDFSERSMRRPPRDWIK